MPQARFARGSRFILNAQVFIVEEELGQDNLLLLNQTFGGQVRATHQELEAEWAAGRLRFEKTGKNTKLSASDSPAREYDVPDLSALTPFQQQEAVRRYNLILPLLHLKPSERTRARLQEYVRSLRRDITPDAHAVGSDSSISNNSPPQAEPRTLFDIHHSEKTTNALDEEPHRKGGRKKAQRLGEAQSARTLQRYLQAYQDSGGDIRSLVARTEKQGGRNKARLQLEVEECIAGVLQWCVTHKHDADTKRTVEDIFDMVHERLALCNQYRTPANRLKMPSLATLYRRIERAGSRDILSRRLSVLEAQAHAGVLPRAQPTRALEEVEFDVTRLDIIVVSDRDHLPLGRPSICVGRCRTTGVPHGFSLGFRREGYQLVMQALFHAVMPKRNVQARYGTRNPWPACGLMETLKSDNGPGFVNRALSMSAALLGINLEQAPRGKAWFKGAIENFIKDHNRNFTHKVAGSVFSNIMEKGDYDAIENACITLSTFRRMLHIWLLDVYSQKWHYMSGPAPYGLLGGVPSRLWEEQTRAGFHPLWYDDATQVRIWLLAPETRKLSRHGIHFEHLVYQSVELQQLRTLLRPGDLGVSRGGDADVLFKYDADDLSHIYVLDPRNRREWLKVGCTRSDYTADLDMWTHQLLIRFLNIKKAREVDVDALVEARIKLQKLANQELSLAARKGRSRVRLLERQFATRAAGLDLETPTTFVEELAHGGGELGTSGGDKPRLLEQAGSSVSEQQSGSSKRLMSGEMGRTKELGEVGDAADLVYQVSRLTLLDAADAPALTRLGISADFLMQTSSQPSQSLAVAPSAQVLPNNLGEDGGADLTEVVEEAANNQTNKGRKRPKRADGPTKSNGKDESADASTIATASVSVTTTDAAEHPVSPTEEEGKADYNCTDMAALGWGGGYNLPPRGKRVK